MTTEPTSKANLLSEKKIAAKKPLTAVKKAAPRSVAKKMVAKTAPAAEKTMPKQTAKHDKHKKIKMVRDSFSLTEGDYTNLIDMKKKCIAAGVPVKKSELLRAGLLGLMKLSNASLIAAVKQIAIGNNSKSEKA